MESNITAPTNFISLEPAKPTGTPFVPLFPTPEKKLAVLANSDFPDARWNLGGLFIYDNARDVLYDFVRQNFSEKTNIAETHGAPACAWTLDWFNARPLISPATISKKLKAVGDRPATFVLDFDNPFIAKNSLDDTIGNALLHYASQMPRASVSVASDALAEHIRAHFPSLSIRAGTNKVIAENGRGNADYYKNAAEKFSVVALHSDDAFSLPLLENLAKNFGAGKFEITVNDTCLCGCELRERHLSALAKIRQSPWDANPLRERHALLAQAHCEDVIASDAQGTPRAALFSREELSKVYALGFRRFRIQAENLRSEVAFFWSAFRLLFSSRPEHWHYAGLVASSLITKIRTPVPVLPTGLDPLVKRRYD